MSCPHWNYVKTKLPLLIKQIVSFFSDSFRYLQSTSLVGFNSRGCGRTEEGWERKMKNELIEKERKLNEKKKSYEKIFRILIYGEIFSWSGWQDFASCSTPRPPQTLIYLSNLIACFLQAKWNSKTCLNCFQLFSRRISLQITAWSIHSWKLFVSLGWASA